MAEMDVRVLLLVESGHIFGKNSACAGKVFGEW
jgi:hypothetical protein